MEKRSCISKYKIKFYSSILKYKLSEISYPKFIILSGSFGFYVLTLVSAIANLMLDPEPFIFLQKTILFLFPLKR